MRHSSQGNFAQQDKKTNCSRFLPYKKLEQCLGLQSWQGSSRGHRPAEGGFCMQPEIFQEVRDVISCKRMAQQKTLYFVAGL
jgi:hypothetical protein